MQTSRWTASAVAYLIVSIYGCGANLRIVVPQTEPLPAGYVCKGSDCWKASVIDDSSSNRFGTTMISLPLECRRTLAAITVVGPGIPEPRVRVRCGDKSWTCMPAEKDEIVCEEKTKTEEPELDLPLPQECKSNIHEVLAVNPRSKRSEILVKCAAAETPIGGM